jgi:hypothetical protein
MKRENLITVLKEIMEKEKEIHDYLPNEFDAAKLFENLRSLDDFKEFSKYIVEWISKQD